MRQKVREAAEVWTAGQRIQSFWTDFHSKAQQRGWSDGPHTNCSTDLRG